MYDPLNANLRNIIEIEEYVCGYSEPEKNGRRYHEQERVEVGLARWFRCRDVDGLENEVLRNSKFSCALEKSSWIECCRQLTMIELALAAMPRTAEADCCRSSWSCFSEELLWNGMTSIFKCWSEEQQTNILGT